MSQADGRLVSLTFPSYADDDNNNNAIFHKHTQGFKELNNVWIMILDYYYFPSLVNRTTTHTNRCMCIWTD